MPPLRLTLADSELAAVESVAEGLVLRLAAAQVAWQAPHGQPMHGFCTGVRLHFAGSRVVSQAGTPFGRIAQGRLTLDARPLSGLAVPGQWTGRLVLQLDGGDRYHLQVHAAGLTTEFAADAAVHESVAC